MRKAASIAVALAGILAGCVAASEDPYPGPSGQSINETKCNVSPRGCFKKAAEICKGSYQVVGSSSNAGGLVADIIPGPVTWYRMSFLCGKSDGKMPTFAFRGSQYHPPAVVYTPPRTTNCHKFGSQVSCTSY